LKRLLTALLLFPLLLSACMYEASNQNEATQMVDQWHKAYQTGDWDKVVADYDTKFFKETSKESWLQHLQSFTEKFGPLKDVHQVFQQKDPRFRGDYYIYGYTLIFDHGRADETITILKKLNEDELLIAGHIIKDKK